MTLRDKRQTGTEYRPENNHRLYILATCKCGYYRDDKTKDQHIKDHGVNCPLTLKFYPDK